VIIEPRAAGNRAITGRRFGRLVTGRTAKGENSYCEESTMSITDVETTFRIIISVLTAGGALLLVAALIAMTKGSYTK
jgi:hypothetical protein